MGFPVGYTELLLLPRIFICLLGFLHNLIYTLFRLFGLPDFLDSDPTSTSIYTNQENSFSAAAATKVAVEMLLPVIRFSELNRPGSGLSDSCAVCINEFESEDEIRRLKNCQHIYHRICLDHWIIGYSQMTCPLCRTPFIHTTTTCFFKN
ncbi:unnamed protein product [Cochlearia groenlandica]